MLVPEDLPRLRWNPAMDRVENFALYTSRRGGLPNAGMPLGATPGPAERRQGVTLYLMACGHESLPNRAVCARGCLHAPAWGAPFRGTAAKPRGVS